jgi:hypothetical protein
LERRLCHRTLDQGRAAYLGLALLAACAPTPADPFASTNTTPPTTCPITSAVNEPHFAAHVLPVLHQTCGAGSALTCHGTPSPAGHVSWSPTLAANQVWAQLVDVGPSNAPVGVGWKRIAPGDLGRSWLIEKVTRDDPGGAGQAYGNRMPYGLPNLCDATVQTIEAWILRGAPND